MQRIYWLGLLIAGGIIALLATYWDDAWHTDRGRDALLTPPHVLLYAGIMLAMLGVTLWTLHTFMQEQTLAHLWHETALMLALTGVVATVASAPLDATWHAAFGRDAILWSPPHLLGVVGMLTIGSSTLLASRRRDGQHGLLMTLLAGAITLGALMIPVMEYEADVPQFATIWYLPLLTIGAALAFALVRAVAPSPWLATCIAAIYTGIRLVITLFLIMLHFSLPLIPLLVIPAVAYDLAFRWRWSPCARAALFGGVVFGVYVPYLAVVVQGVQVDLTGVIVGLPLAIIGAWLAMHITAPEPRTLSSKGLAVFLLLLVLVLVLPTGQVLAHDPGQGTEIGQASLVARVQQRQIRISGIFTSSQNCGSFIPQHVVARRAGRVVTAALQRNDPCHYKGTISVPDTGRWFIYCDFMNNGQVVETWLPVLISSDTQQFSKQSSLYIVTATSGSPLQIASSIVLYTICLILLGGILMVFRRHQAMTSGLSLGA